MGAPQYEALALANEPAVREPPIPQTFTSPQSDAPVIARKHVLEPFTEGIENAGDEPVELTHIHSPQIQYAMPQGVSTPLMAEAEERGMETSATTEPFVPPTPEETPEPTTSGIDINRIAEEVYEIIEERLRSEKERRGYF
jgi:hypothetical protein